MHDIKAVRAAPEAFDTALKARGVSDPQAQALIALDDAFKAARTAAQDAQTARNAASKDIGKAKAAGDEDTFNALREKVAALKITMEAEEAKAHSAEQKRDALLAALPNTALDDVPVGEDEAANVEVPARAFGQPNLIGPGEGAPRDHVEVGEGLGEMDFETAVAMSGSRFVMLKGQLARLERALAAFMLDLHVGEHGYEEIAPPYLVREKALFGTGQLPKFAEDLFDAGGDHALIPTAEVPLTNIVADQIVLHQALPRRYVAYTPCFRSEAGSAGRDTRGMIRLHQFSKVELVSITAPEDSAGELERMTDCAQEVLKRLELPHKVAILSTGDMGFAARKTYDIEVWVPSQNTYREISSCSTCGDFQARRMNARMRREGEKQLDFVHTLNGSAVAVGRCMVALLENFQNADGSVTLPDALRPLMGGRDRLAPAAPMADAIS